MKLFINGVFGIVYRNLSGRITVFNGRVVAIGTRHFSLKFMNSRGVIVIVRLRLAGIIRAIAF